MYATDPDKPHRPKLEACPHCGANGAACDSLRWLRARACCDNCRPGDHDGGAPDAA